MQDYLFFPTAVWVLVSALMVVLCRQPMHAALGFGLSSLGTAALCAMVKAPFLAAAQTLVYGGTAGLVSATLFAALAVKGGGDLLPTVLRRWALRSWYCWRVICSSLELE